MVMLVRLGIQYTHRLAKNTTINIAITDIIFCFHRDCVIEGIIVPIVCVVLRRRIVWSQ